MQYDISSNIIEPLLAKYRAYITGKYINNNKHPQTTGYGKTYLDTSMYCTGDKTYYNWTSSTSTQQNNVPVNQCETTCQDNTSCEGYLINPDNDDCFHYENIKDISMFCESGSDPPHQYYGKIKQTAKNKIIRYPAITPDQDQIQQALSLTNCFSSKDIVTSYSNLLESCKSTLSAELNSQSSKNKTLNNLNKNKLPMVWSINEVANANHAPCTFSISSSKLYTKESQWQKFAEFDPTHNKTKMSLYEGGTNQVINLENATILTESNGSTLTTSGINTDHILVSGNLKTSNPKKFLIPSKVKSGFYNDSSIINLKNTPNDNGKWIMFGFNLMNIQNLEKTLKAIQAKL